MKNTLDSSIANRNLLEDYSNLTAVSTVGSVYTTAPTSRPSGTTITSAPTTTSRPTTTTTKPVATTATRPVSASTAPRALPLDNLGTPTNSVATTSLPNVPSATMGGGGGGASEPDKSADATSDTGLVAPKLIFGQEPKVIYATVGLAIVGGIAGYFTAKKMSKSTTMFSIVGAVAGASVGFVTTKYVFTNKGEKKSNFATLNYPKAKSDLHYPKTKSELNYPKTKSDLHYPKTKSDLHYPKNK